MGTTRQNEYFHREVPVANTLQPKYEHITVTADDGSTIAQEQGNVYVPQTPEYYTYDFDGNLLSDGRWNYTWDAENRLIGMETIAAAPAGAKKKLAFVYDYMARRVKKQVWDWDTVTSSWITEQTRTFVYDGWNLVAELDPSQGSAIMKKYVWGLDLSGSMQGAGGVGGLLSVTTGAGMSYALADANGNVMKLVDADTLEVSGEYEYGPFGELIRMTGPAAKANPFRFSSKYHDEASGLLYYGFRYYDAEKGRWLNRDLLGETGGVNLYAIAGNDILNQTDLLGLITIVDAEVLRHAVKYYVNPFYWGPEAPSITIESIRWGVEASPKVYDYLQSQSYRLCICNKKTIVVGKILQKVNTDHIWSIGRTTAIVKGNIDKLKIKGTKLYWKFTGRVGPQHDRFDFDVYKDRPLPAQVLTIIGNLSGLPTFDILSTGSFKHIMSGISDCSSVWGH